MGTMALALDKIVADFARGMADADARLPRSKQWQPGIGPHDEKDLIRLVVAEMGRVRVGGARGAVTPLTHRRRLRAGRRSSDQAGLRG
jgi:hypothetical protein